RRDIFQFRYDATLQNALNDLRIMYEDIFVYGYRGMTEEYNSLSYDDRLQITCLYTSLTTLYAMFNRYNWDEETISITNEEHSFLNSFLAELHTGGQVYIKWLDEMMIVSILYKYRHCYSGATAVFEDN